MEIKLKIVNTIYILHGVLKIDHSHQLYAIFHYDQVNNIMLLHSQYGSGVSLALLLSLSLSLTIFLSIADTHYLSLSLSLFLFLSFLPTAGAAYIRAHTRARRIYYILIACTVVVCTYIYI